MILDVTAEMLETAVKTAVFSPHEDLLKFIISQLRLMLNNSHQYRYDSDLIIHTFLWKMTSSALYNKLSSFFVLPSTRRLQQLSCGLNVRPDELDSSYFHSRSFRVWKGKDSYFVIG